MPNRPSGRPQKDTVDWFPHDSGASDDSKTLAILENHFQTEGYTAWFKLLERLSKTRNHIIDCRLQTDIEFLAAKCRFAPDRFRQILDKMAELGAIDTELYVHGFIWCQNLVDRLKPVYDNRKQPLPDKPAYSTVTNTLFYPRNTVETPNIPVGSPPPTNDAQSFQYTPPVGECSVGECSVGITHPALLKNRNGHRPLFDKVCQEYPKQDDLKYAEPIFYQYMDDGTLTEESVHTVLIPAIRIFRNSPKWQEHNGDFVPKLEKFLDRKQWLRVPKPETQEEKIQRRKKWNARAIPE